MQTITYIPDILYVINFVTTLLVVLLAFGAERIGYSPKQICTIVLIILLILVVTEAFATTPLSATTLLTFNVIILRTYVLSTLAAALFFWLIGFYRRPGAKKKEE